MTLKGGPAGEGRDGHAVVVGDLDDALDVAGTVRVRCAIHGVSWRARASGCEVAGGEEDWAGKMEGKG